MDGLVSKFDNPKLVHLRAPKKTHIHMLTYLGLRLIGLQEATSLGHFGNGDVGQNKSPGDGSDIEITDAEQKISNKRTAMWLPSLSLSLFLNT